MDDDEQQVVLGFNPGAGVVITCDVPEGTEKYIGYVIGMDDMYVYARVTHTWGERTPEVTPESLAMLKTVLYQQPLWMLRAKVAWRTRLMPFWFTKDDLVEILSDEMQWEAIEKAGPQSGFIAEPLPTEMSLAHYTVRNIKSLADVMGSSVLASLDFAPASEYTEEPEEGDHGDGSTEEPKSGD